ncbi:hypothetical protein CEXT_156881, partial [Caerostris extrusa]
LSAASDESTKTSVLISRNSYKPVCLSVDRIFEVSRRLSWSVPTRIVFPSYKKGFLLTSFKRHPDEYDRR